MPEKRLVRLLLQQCTSAQLDLSGTDPATEPQDDPLRQCGTPDDDGVLRVSHCGSGVLPVARASSL